MAITNTNPQPKDVVILQRDDTNTFYGETHISGSDKIIYIDSSGYVNADDSSSFYTLFPPASGTGGGGTTLYTGSTYDITASWAKSASWANTASWAINAINGGTQLNTGSTYDITASWAESASWAPATPSDYSVSSSWASASLSASWAPATPSDTSISASWASQSAACTGTSLYASSSLEADISILSWFSISGSYALTASVALNALSAVSASWASSSISSSFSANATTFTASAGIQTNAYTLGSSYTNSQLNSYTITNADDGKLVVVNSGSLLSITVTTSSINTGFNAMYYQSGSARMQFLTASVSVFLRNRQSQTGSAGQYAMVSLIRVPNGDFVLGGDTA